MLDGTVQFIGYRFAACPAALRASEKRFAACRAMIALAFRPGPLHAAFLVTKLGYLVPP